MSKSKNDIHISIYDNDGRSKGMQCNCDNNNDDNIIIVNRIEHVTISSAKQKSYC